MRGNDRDIVIDAGLGVVALRQAIPGLFERDPMVVLTHAHLEHVGGASEFGDRAAHPAEAGILAAGGESFDRTRLRQLAEAYLHRTA